MAIETAYKTSPSSVSLALSGAIAAQEPAKHLGVGGQMIAIGAAAVRTAQLAAGRWRISGSGDIWFKQGDVTVVASAAATSAFLSAGAIEVADVENTTTEGYISVIRDGAATGNVSITKVS